MKKHKLYTITKNDIFGRYIVATTDIKQGQLIIKEEPIVLCPQISGSIVCFNCCAQLKKLYFCKNCAAAALCNSECKGKFHTSEECSIFKTKQIRREDLITNPEIVTPLRVLLWREYNEKLFNRLLRLESHLEARRDSQIYRRIHVNIDNILFNLKYLDESDLKDEVIQKICAILDINTFDVRQPKTKWSIPDENLRGLFLEAAMMVHDCIANSHLSVDDDYMLYVRAAVDIPKGSQISFNYTNVLHGNSERQRQLIDGKHFQCICKRCCDPTELGTEMSSLKCPRCHKGLLRPKSWECSFCNRLYHESLIKMTLAECRRKISEIQEPNIDFFEKLSNKLRFTFHPNHYLILEIEQILIRLYIQSGPSVKYLQRKIELCEKILEIFKKIEPGISRIQAITMYELHSGLVQLAEKIYNSNKIRETEFLKMLLVAEVNLKSSIKYLLYEPMKSPEGRLTQSALTDLKCLRDKISQLQNREKKMEQKKHKKKNKGQF